MHTVAAVAWLVPKCLPALAVQHQMLSCLCFIRIAAVLPYQQQGAGAGQQQQQYMQPFQAQHLQQQQQQADMQWQAGQEGMQQQAQQMQWPGQQPQQAVLPQQLHQDPLPAPGGERPILEVCHCTELCMSSEMQLRQQD